MSTEQRDRYVTFEGLDCDANAIKIMEALHAHLAGSAAGTKWGDYFSGKLVEQQRLNVDDLFFVGSQINTLFAFFEEIGDQETYDLLYQVEQECC